MKVDNQLAGIAEGYILQVFSRPADWERGVELQVVSITINMMNNKWLHMVTWILIIIGALNWGLVGLGGFMGGNWNLVNLILGSWPQVEWIVYILVGLSAVFELVVHRNNCKVCGSSGGGMM